MIGGWIKLHYSLLEWEWYDDNNVKILFFHLLLKANWQEKKWRGKTIKRGQFITSISNLSEETHLTIKQTRLALDKLKKTNEIATKGTNQYTIVTICNYEKYQEVSNQKGKQTDEPQGNQKANGGQTEGKQRATTKEYKTIKKEKNIRHIGGKNSEFLDDCLRDAIWIESICRLNKTKPDEVNKHLSRFNDYLISTDDVKQNLRDFKGHFTNWFRNQDFKTIQEPNKKIL